MYAQSVVPSRNAPSTPYADALMLGPYGELCQKFGDCQDLILCKIQALSGSSNTHVILPRWTALCCTWRCGVFGTAEMRLSTARLFRPLKHREDFLSVIWTLFLVLPSTRRRTWWKEKEWYLMKVKQEVPCVASRWVIRNQKLDGKLLIVVE